MPEAELTTLEELKDGDGKPLVGTVEKGGFKTFLVTRSRFVKSCLLVQFILVILSVVWQWWITLLAVAP